MTRFVLAASLGLLLAASPTLADVVYEEVTNLDDLPIDPPYPVFALSLGTNSVLGRTSFNADAVDSFAVSVPEGLQLASVTYVFTSSAFTRGGKTLTEAISGLSLFTGDGVTPQPRTELDAQNLDMIPGLCSPLVTPPCGPSSESAITVALFENALPIDAGIYSVEQRALTVNDPEFVNWTARYRIDLVVVPETDSASGIAAAAIAWLARRRRSRA